MLYQVSPYPSKRLRKLTDTCAARHLILYLQYLFTSKQLHYGVPILCWDVLSTPLLYEGEWWWSISLTVSLNLSLIILCSRSPKNRWSIYWKESVKKPDSLSLCLIRDGSCQITAISDGSSPLQPPVPAEPGICCKNFLFLGFVAYTLHGAGNGKEMIKNGKELIIWSEMTEAQQGFTQS